MEFSKVATDTAKNATAAVKYILSLQISPEAKRTLLQGVIRGIGVPFYYKLFNAASEVFDSEAIGTLGLLDENQEARLATKIIRNQALGREISYLVQDYFDSNLGKAQYEAYKNAVSLEKHPTLERIIVGETCEWCTERAGIIRNPSGEDFARHRDCDCKFIVSGYNSRNGELKNYVKEKR